MNIPCIRPCTTLSLLLTVSFLTGDIDFNTTNQAVTFPSGITTSNVSISVFNDAIVEGDEMFDLTLTVPEIFNGRISAGSRDIAVGDITDHTSESSNTTVFVLKCTVLYNNGQTIN